jgi:hypothetical protein
MLPKTGNRSARGTESRITHSGRNARQLTDSAVEDLAGGLASRLRPERRISTSLRRPALYRGRGLVSWFHPGSDFHGYDGGEGRSPDISRNPAHSRTRIDSINQTCAGQRGVRCGDKSRSDAERSLFSNPSARISVRHAKIACGPLSASRIAFHTHDRVVQPSRRTSGACAHQP